MPTTDASFDALAQALRSIWSPDGRQEMALDTVDGVLLLSLPSDVAAFALLNGHPDQEFPQAYDTFKRLYRDHNQDWDRRTLSFVACRSSQRSSDDRFYASLETDPLFCRKYVIRAHRSVEAQRSELLRLPFLPLPSDTAGSLKRPASAQDMLQAAGLPATLARQIVEPSLRSAERIARDLVNDGAELPARLHSAPADQQFVKRPRASSRLLALAVEGFRAYRDEQSFDLDASVVVLYGPNGLGKTSFFDALDYACTGRIGRLCRNRRSASDFARIATHLDKTPGSGSVSLTVRADGEQQSNWKLQRSTGDWSTAWIDGESAERKDVLNKLTQAQWIDSSPRQQNLESLFRATHLFGQDEQELLTEFRRASVIPEAFISEMLALQDYAQALSKVADVLAHLRDLHSAANENLGLARDERSRLEDARDRIATTAAFDGTVLEDLLVQLQRHAADDSLDLPGLPNVATAETVTQWQNLALEHARDTDGRLTRLRQLEQGLPEHREGLRRQGERTSRLAELSLILSSCERELGSLARQSTKTSEDIAAAASRRADAERVLAAIQQAESARVAHERLTREIADLERQRDADKHALGDLDSRISQAQKSLAAILEAQIERDRSRAGIERRLTDVRDLLSRLPVVVEAQQARSSLAAQLGRANDILEQAMSQHAQAQETLRMTRSAREAHEALNERASIDKRALEDLLDQILGHVKGDSCPLCGTGFASEAGLLAAIRMQRESSPLYTAVNEHHQQLLLSERSASADEATRASDLARARSSVEELQRALQVAATAIGDFETRVEEVLGVRDATATLSGILTSAEAELVAQRAAAHEESGASRRQREASETSLSLDAATRRAAAERLDSVNASIDSLNRQLPALQASIAKGGVALVGFSPDREAEEARSALQEAIAAHDALVASQMQLRPSIEALRNKQRQVSGEQAELATQAASKDESLTAFSGEMRLLGLPEDCQAADVDRLAAKFMRRSDALRAIVDEAGRLAGVLGAREARMRVDALTTALATNAAKILDFETRTERLERAEHMCEQVEALLKREQQRAVEKHIEAYGPMITMIQQRLRSVYGFGSVQLAAHGGEAKVRVEWRNKNVQVPPTDFFSDSQKQILMLSIFLAGGLRQNWSGFAPVLLDDPVTHFDDLNAYGFVELIRGVIASSPNEWQFIISTCEQRLFDLMQKKFTRLPSGAVFYEFLGMSDAGPIVERR